MKMKYSSLLSLLAVKKLIWLLWFLRGMMLAGAVVKFPCGHDLCVPNEGYCNHHDSEKSESWTCSPCHEDRSRCPTLQVHPHCYGYCEKLKTEEIQRQHQEQMNKMSLKLTEAEQMGNKSVSTVMLQWKSSNNTYKQTLAAFQHDSDDNRMLITCLKASTIVLAVAFLCSVVYCCYKCQRKHNKGSLLSLTSSDVNTDDNQPLQVLITSQNDDQDTCEGTRRAREMMTNQNPADHEGPSNLVV